MLFFGISIGIGIGISIGIGSGNVHSLSFVGTSILAEIGQFLYTKRSWHQISSKSLLTSNFGEGRIDPDMILKAFAYSSDGPHSMLDLPWEGRCNDYSRMRRR